MEQINFFDENGKLYSLEEIQTAVEEIYNQVSEQTKDNSEDYSILDDLINPECQIDCGKAVDTLSFLERSVYLCDEIKPETGIGVADMIRFWNKVDNADEIPAEERTPIKVFIDSPGGDLDATFSIIDSIALSKTPVWTITIGTGYSGGFFIGIAGHKRIGYKHSSYLFHEGCAQSGGDAHKYIQGVKFYERKLASLRKLTLKYTKFTEEDYKKHKKDDLWMTADDALKYGVIDEIATEIV